jgi:hypothetical protein
MELEDALTGLAGDSRLIVETRTEPRAWARERDEQRPGGELSSRGIPVAPLGTEDPDA